MIFFRSLKFTFSSFIYLQGKQLKLLLGWPANSEKPKAIREKLMAASQAVHTELPKQFIYFFGFIFRGIHVIYLQQQ